MSGLCPGMEWGHGGGTESELRSRPVPPQAYQYPVFQTMAPVWQEMATSLRSQGQVNT
jgi:hypothetical protein